MGNEKILKLLNELKEAMKWKKWGEEVYTPYYNSQTNTTEDDSGGNPTGPLPAPPGSGG